ncbi:hypothetical protein GALMADRAFT_144367 [Galerina marginata CBS 339.88]|uniref:Uncharacterized protein n=1 Tax=Galerina marginata (strain CBS 339.88) TaxID=685588 RepID=A0A067SLK7_GALM3|nr:hypothetical protein GALMADRAFT_144367 [Galerina marginata CBS 339.88]
MDDAWYQLMLSVVDASVTNFAQQEPNGLFNVLTAPATPISLSWKPSSSMDWPKPSERTRETRNEMLSATSTSNTTRHSGPRSQRDVIRRQQALPAADIVLELATTLRPGTCNWEESGCEG